MITVTGRYTFPNSAREISARAQLSGSDLRVYDSESDAVVDTSALEDISFGAVIPGLAVDATLQSQGVFRPDDADFDWPHQSGFESDLRFFERHWSTVLSSLILVPVFLYLTIVYLVPYSARTVVPLLPDWVAVESSESTLNVLDNSVFRQSQLPLSVMKDNEDAFYDLVGELGLTGAYKLKFRRLPGNAVNAMALPDGTVILSDSFVEEFAQNPEARDAVFLHEIGHVEGHHGLTMMTQTAAMSVVYAMIFGDIEGIADAVLGGAVGLIELSFSRDMEREADAYAVNQLLLLGKSPEALATALKLISESAKQEHNASMSDYLSSHPNIHERILSIQEVN